MKRVLLGFLPLVIMMAMSLRMGGQEGTGDQTHVLPCPDCPETALSDDGDAASPAPDAATSPDAAAIKVKTGTPGTKRVIKVSRLGSRISWENNDPSWHVDFKGASPCEAGQKVFNASNSVCNIAKDARLRTYHYTLSHHGRKAMADVVVGQFTRPQ